MKRNERNMTMCEMRDNGATFTEIAREFGISTERARQIYVAQKTIEESDGAPMYRALCEAAEDAGRPYPERAASRAYHYLVRSGITELAQLADYSDSQLLKIRCFGIGSLEIARAAQAKAVHTEGPQVEEPEQIDFDGVVTVFGMTLDEVRQMMKRDAERERTCKDLGGTGSNDEQVFNCSECGCMLSLYDRDGSNNLFTSFIFDYPRYCPSCGARVIGADE